MFVGMARLGQRGRGGWGRMEGARLRQLLALLATQSYIQVTPLLDAGHHALWAPAGGLGWFDSSESKPNLDDLILNCGYIGGECKCTWFSMDR